MAYQSFNYEVHDGIGTMRLNNPERLNALTFQTYEELEKLTAQLAKDNDVKVLVLTGTGKGFCSGGSVNEIIGKLVEMKGDDLYRFTRMTCNVVQNMRRLEKPIIAAVNGIAAGAGAMLALASDFRILATSAKFAFLFVKVGLAGADMGALYLLPRIVGEGRANELLFLGDTISSADAYRMGLATRVVDDDKLMDETYALAGRLKEGPLFALGLTKTLLRMEAHADLETALELEAQAQARCMDTSDFREGYRAFLEKRQPRFNQDLSSSRS
jgi:enoyl-CoA hydratase/carnithine racemase